MTEQNSSSEPAPSTEQQPPLPTVRKRRKRRNFKAYRDYALHDLETVLQHNAPAHQHLFARLWPVEKFYTAPDNDDHENDEKDKTENPDTETDDESATTNNREDITPAELPDEQLTSLDGYFYFHITSRIHLSKRLLSKDEVKEILSAQCLHYARACKVALLNYCILEEHVHLLVGIKTESYCEARAKAAKMIGCIKQQFTKRYKHWHAEIYRVRRKYRIKPLTKGTLWNGRAHIEYLADEADLLACTLYVEANHIKINAANQIKSLEVPPNLTIQPSNPETSPSVDDPYNPILTQLKGYLFQSAGWYLNAEKGHHTALSDGTDGNWATPAELKIWWDCPVRNLPIGWRKVWFKEGGGILKNTPNSARRYPKQPALELFGETREARAKALSHLLLAVCWHNRTAVWARPELGQEEPGANEA